MSRTLDGIKRGFIGDGPTGPDVRPSLNVSKQTKTQKQNKKQTHKQAKNYFNT